MLSKNNNENIDVLMGILKDEYDVYLEEYSLLEKKIDFIKEKKVNDLNILIKAEQEILTKIVDLEQKRLSLVKTFGENISLKDLAYMIEDEVLRGNLLAFRDKLLNILEDIRVKNELSSQLIDVSSKMLDTLLKEVSGEKEIGYDKFSQKSSMVNNNLLNTRG